MSEENEIKTILIKHISDSKHRWEAFDLRMGAIEISIDLMEKSINRHNEYEVGAKAIITVGKIVILVGGILVTAWGFFHTYFKIK